MKIRRDYTQPFFRQPKRHSLRNIFIAAALGLLLGLAIIWQRDTVEGLVLTPSSATQPRRRPKPSELAARASAALPGGRHQPARRRCWRGRSPNGPTTSPTSTSTGAS